MITTEHRQQIQSDGYTVVRQLFALEEAAAYRDHFMRMRREGSYAGDFAGVKAKDDDPLRAYPRMIHMHRWDAVSLRWMLEPRINAALTAFLGQEPYAVQTMLYFKPPGARGQALHQDNYYLRVQPGTCMAAWMALDDCDELNGCMQIVPGSHTWPVLCTTEADTAPELYRRHGVAATRHAGGADPHAGRGCPLLQRPAGARQLSQHH